MHPLLRKLKPAYRLYNYFQKDRLKHNEEKYRMLGLKKSYHSLVCSRDFEGLDPKILKAGKTYPNPEQTLLFKRLDAESQASLRDFNENGFAVLKGFFDAKTIEKVIETVEYLKKKKKIKEGRNGKIMFAVYESLFLNSLGDNPMLNELTAALLQGDAKLFQSINANKINAQAEHTDSMHISTFPPGGSLGFWIALEDTKAGQEQIFFYPKSHTLPYYRNSEFGNQGNALLVGKQKFSSYEDMLKEKIKERGLEKQFFTAKKGDVLIWHANLVHGATETARPNTSAKHMVFHYFDNDCVCYHEITQRPALMRF